MSYNNTRSNNRGYGNGGNNATNTKNSGSKRTKPMMYPTALFVQRLMDFNYKIEATLRSSMSDSERQLQQNQLRDNLVKLDRIASKIETNPKLIKTYIDEVKRDATNREFLIRVVSYFLHFLSESDVISNKKVNVNSIGRDTMTISYKVGDKNESYTI